MCTGTLLSFRTVTALGFRPSGGPGPPTAMRRALWTSVMPPLMRTCHQTSWSPGVSPWRVITVTATGFRPHSSSAKVRSYIHYLKRKIKPAPTPPYSYVCQVGDPVLRGRAAAVEPGAVLGAEVQEVIRKLVTVMRRLESVGLSAPQIGVPLRILALEFPERMLQDVSPAGQHARALAPVPLRIFVNPQLRVLDARTAAFMEACESIAGFSACVPRYLSVEVSGGSAEARTLERQTVEQRGGETTCRKRLEAAPTGAQRVMAY
ncbi:peptide deformylase, mitochondrial-like isoform X2 [Paramormyrops kingsleyae]|uniref:peptide deformylase, mitochondrial-like isoform X2 n=1 Tax=Paramormyrops kingsleyae TaxID=1676925 RepID=UPI003B97468D